MKTLKIVLGGKGYEIAELPTRKNEVWRQILETKLNPIIDIIKGLAAQELSVDNALQIAGPVEEVIKIAMASPVEIRDMVISYSPVLEKSKEKLLDTAYDSEFTSAFMEILGLAYPFGAVAKALGGLSPNGDLKPEIPGPT